MLPLALRLQARGYRVHRFSYPSVRCTLEQAAARLQNYCAALDADVLHFVGHSLGGLVIQTLFQFHSPQCPGRVVTLGTPHTGSQAAAAISQVAVGRALLGRGVLQLVHGAPSAWPAPEREVGVIAGARRIGFGRLLVPGLPAPSDGTIVVAETRLTGIRDHTVLPVSHAGMLFSSQVAGAICRFLKTGRFG